PSSLYKGFRFPGTLISHAVWLYYRFLPVTLRGDRLTTVGGRGLATAVGGEGFAAEGIPRLELLSLYGHGSELYLRCRLPARGCAPAHTSASGALHVWGRRHPCTQGMKGMQGMKEDRMADDSERVTVRLTKVQALAAGAVLRGYVAHQRE